MQAISHKIKHQYQPTPTSCSATALAILFSFFDKTMTVEEIGLKVPHIEDEEGNDRGTVNSQLATWCVGQDFDVSMYVFDCQIIDQSWTELSQEEIAERLQACLGSAPVPALGSFNSDAYRQSYIDFIKAGGTLFIQPYGGSDLMYELLKASPILTCVSLSTMYGTGRELLDDAVDEFDDVNGRAVNHTIVVYGYDQDGRFLVADPWVKPGLVVVEPERLVAAIATAQLECDNLLFQLVEKHDRN